MSNIYPIFVDKYKFMEIRFNEEYLRDLYQTGKCQIIINRKYMNNYKTISVNMIANNLTPATPTHSGEILKDEIEYRGISQRKLAEEMGIAYSALNEILNARRPITEKTALLFEAALGINAEPLLKMQMRYNLLSTKQDATFMQRLANVRRIAAAL